MCGYNLGSITSIVCGSTRDDIPPDVSRLFVPTDYVVQGYTGS